MYIEWFCLCIISNGLYHELRAAHSSSCVSVLLISLIDIFHFRLVHRAPYSFTYCMSFGKVTVVSLIMRFFPRLYELFKVYQTRTNCFRKYTSTSTKPLSKKKKVVKEKILNISFEEIIEDQLSNASKLQLLKLSENQRLDFWTNLSKVSKLSDYWFLIIINSKRYH